MHTPALPSIRSPGLIAIIISGCFLLVSCASAPGPSVKGSKKNPYVATINFESECKIKDVVSETTECKNKDHKDFCVARGNYVRWKSNKLFDDGSKREIEYVIYFDPIDKARKYSSDDGLISRKMKTDAPLALYKYSILGLSGCNPDMDTFDPHIRVDK